MSPESRNIPNANNITKDEVTKIMEGIETEEHEFKRVWFTPKSEISQESLSTTLLRTLQSNSNTPDCLKNLI